jgi:hypothetical protein
MNRWIGILILAVLCFVTADRGECASLAELVASNQSKLIQMSVGMTKNEVTVLMGSDTAQTKDGIVHNPWIAESYTDKGGAQYEVLYYVTRKNPPFTPIRKSLTTPIVLKDGKVIGWGDAALQHAIGDRSAQ